MAIYGTLPCKHCDATFSGAMADVGLRHAAHLREAHGTLGPHGATTGELLTPAKLTCSACGCIHVGVPCSGPVAPLATLTSAMAGDGLKLKSMIVERGLDAATGDQLRAELERRGANGLGPACLGEFTDGALRKECERRELISGELAMVDIVRKLATRAHLGMVEMASRKHNELSFMTAERDEWKRRAEALEEDAQDASILRDRINRVCDVLIKTESKRDRDIFNALTGNAAYASPPFGTTPLQGPVGLAAWLPDKPVIVPVSAPLTPEECALIAESSDAGFVWPTERHGCGICGAEAGQPCTKACDDDSVPDGVAMRDAVVRRAEADGLKGFAAWLRPTRDEIERGPGIAALPERTRGDAVDLATLADLLCEDA